ncbi:MAG: YlxR family protein [Clostridia bacterium]|nr:YlxR family protein [Clostridia bacterium]
MKIMKKVPLRRCLGCFESKPKNELIRVVKSKEGEITLDKTGKKQGRGAYICYNKDCLEKVIKTKKLDKEFDTLISNDIYENLRRDFDSDK